MVNQHIQYFSDNTHQEIYRKSDTQNKITVAYYANEIFKPYPKDTNYLIGDYGTGYSLKTGKKLSIEYDKDGYERIYLGKTVRVHRAVLETHKPELDLQQNQQVNHIDGKKGNNNVNNLEPCTCQYNIEHACRLGLRTQFEENHGMSKYTNEFIDQFCKLMSQGYQDKEIAKILQIPEENWNKIQYLGTRIRKGDSWRKYKEKYNLTTKYLKS